MQIYQFQFWILVPVQFIQVQLLYIVQTRRNILKPNRNSHTHLTETPSFAWYVAAALKPLS